MSNDISSKIYPTQLLSFYEVLVLIGCEDSDAELFSDKYATFNETVGDWEFIEMLNELKFVPDNFRNGGLQYWDIDFQTNVDICIIDGTELYMVTPF